MIFLIIPLLKMLFEFNNTSCIADISHSLLTLCITTQLHGEKSLFALQADQTDIQ